MTSAGRGAQREAAGGPGPVPDGAPVEAGPPAGDGEPGTGMLRLARAILPSSLADVGFEIPWSQRFSTRLYGMLAAVALATVGAFFLAEVAVQRHLLAQVVGESDLLGQTARSALYRAMLQDRRNDAYETMRDIAGQREIDHLRLLTADGKVAFSTAPGEEGRTVDRTAEACLSCHAGAEPLRGAGAAERSRIYAEGDHRVAAIVTPIYNEPSCSTAACHAHPAGRKVLGVLDVGISLRRVDAETAEFRWRTTAAAAAAAGLLSLFVWAFARRHFVRPVAALVQGTRRVARDQLDLEIPVTWSGELGLLAASFNEMTRSLRGAHRQLAAANAGLEQQVEERTAALRAAQDQLVRQEKLSSLGKLAASIAHEINNPLAGILTFAKLIARTLDQGAPDEPTRRAMVKNLLLVQRETERCSAIVRNLLDFARERPMAVKDVDVVAVLDEGLQLLANQLHIQGVAVDRRVAPVPPVEGDFGQLRQAVVNVVMNACEAMGKGGRLAIAVGPAGGGRWVELAFADTGPGIAPEHLSRIFDPFFTTKEKGTGLGLSVVYGIVERHHGKIEISSEAGKGTRVAIRLPPRAGAPDGAADRAGKRA